MTNQVKINSEVLGNSPIAIVMLHGWGHSMEELRPLAELLSSDFQVHLIDLPGFGQSEIPPEAWSTREFAACIIDYLDQAKIKRAIFFGHSFGGRIAIRISASYPDRVLGLMLVSAAGLRRTYSLSRKLCSNYISALRFTIKKIDTVFGTNIFNSWFVPLFASADYKKAGPMRATFVRVVNEDLSVEASRIQCPTFMLWGEKDTETPVEAAIRIHGLIEGSTLTVLPGKDHNLHLNAGSHLCAYYLIPFLKQFH